MTWTDTVIKQEPGSPDCVACVAAMAAGTSLEEFKAFVGGLRGPYPDAELIAFLFSRGIFPGLSIRFEEPTCVGYSFPSVEIVPIGIDWRFQGQAAYLGVQSRNYPDAEHAVFWNGRRVLDPDPSIEVDGLSLAEYRLISVLPLYRLSEREVRLRLYAEPLDPEGRTLEDLRKLGKPPVLGVQRHAHAFLEGGAAPEPDDDPALLAKA